MANQMDEQALTFVSEGIQHLAEQNIVSVFGKGPEGYIEATFEFDALTAAAAVSDAESIVLRVLAMTAADEVIPWEAAAIERIRVARAPTGDEGTLESS